ncbi:MAG: ABC transporter permease [Cyclobacteriaceae bacterium]
MFDLEIAIKKWLKQFSKHRAFDDGSVREMELHLRDHIDDLIASGLSEEKAFNLAVSEFGEVSSMAKEEFTNTLPAQRFHYVGMYKNYLRVAFRNLTKQPFFTFLNTFGLAVGIAGGLLIGLFIYDELSFDLMFPDADRIYRINIDNQTNGEYSEYASAPGPMAGVLYEDCPQVEMLTRFREVGSTLIRKPDEALNVKVANVVAVDTSFFAMFGLRLVKGNAATALSKPRQMIMTRTAAKTHFGDKDALGQSLILDDDAEYIVTGILEELPKNSLLRNNNIFLSLTSFEDEKTVAWNTWYFPTFVKIKTNTSVKDLQAFLDTVKDKYLIPWAMTFVPGLTVESAKAAEKASGNFMRFNTTALTDIHLYSANRRGEFSPNGDIQNVYIMSVIGLILLVLAAVNFMNLSTAYSLTRAKEVGIRKTLGSNRFGLIKQFLSESIVISLLSVLMALLLTIITLPLFNDLAGKSISIPFDSWLFWILVVAAGLFMGIISGGYPAFFMSRFIPAQVLKGNLVKAGGGEIRDALVIFQFAIAIFLIISTMVVYQQVNYIRSKDLGFQKDQILVVDEVGAAGKQVQNFREQVAQLSAVERVSLSSYLPTPSARSSITYFVEGAIGEGEFKSENALIIEQWDIDYDYVNTLSLEIIAGRNFDNSHSTDSSALLINETTATMLGVSPEKAIGMRLTTDFHRADKENMKYLTIVGVVKNFHFSSLRNNIGALSFILASDANKMMVKIRAGDFANVVEQIEAQWSAVAPGQPFNYYFMDQSFNETYREELRLGSIFITFTMLSLFIACLGLFGLATFNAKKRTKEIGIKKVMGASVGQITFQLSSDFLKLVAWSICLAIPISWYVMNRWLEGYSYRMEFNWWIFVIAALLALLISLLTVSYQSIKAATVNPVKSLRSE